MLGFEVTPETRILVELLIIVFAGMVAMVIENPAPRTEEAPATSIRQVPATH